MKTLLLITSLFFSFALSARNPVKGPVKENALLVATDKYKGYVINIYKNVAGKTPYSVSIVNSNGAIKEMMVIQNDDDLFKYILVEKTSTELVYYPFAWMEQKMITTSDLKENCRKILDKQVNPIEKKMVK